MLARLLYVGRFLLSYVFNGPGISSRSTEITPFRFGWKVLATCRFISEQLYGTVFPLPFWGQPAKPAIRDMDSQCVVTGMTAGCRGQAFVIVGLDPELPILLASLKATGTNLGTRLAL